MKKISYWIDHTDDDEKRKELQKELAAITEDIVTELDAKLKDAGYSAAANKKAKELGIPIITEDTFAEMFGK